MDNKSTSTTVINVPDQTIMDRVKFDISGQLFAINHSLLNAGPDSALKDLVCDVTHDVIVLDRPPDVFAAILALYQTGELHIPKTCCPGTFVLEMEYWGLRQEQLATCCYFELKRFTNHQESLKKFQANLQLALEGSHRSPSHHFQAINNVRDMVWRVVDFRERTVRSTLYFVLSLLMVLVSICNLAFSTDPNFRRNMTNCERYEYMKQFDMEDLHIVEDMLKADCGNGTSSSNVTNAVTPPPFGQLGDASDDFLEVAVEVEIPVTLPPTSTTNIPPSTDPPCETVVMEIEVNETIKNVTTEICPVIEPVGDTFDPIVISHVELKRIKIPNFKIPLDVFKLLELITTVYFTIDIVLRLVSCPSFLGYFTSFVNLADALALVGVYVNWILTSVRPREQYELNWFDLLEYLQMLRSFRLFRLVMSFNISKVLAYSIGQSLNDGFIMVLLLLAGMCTFSICLYLAEDKYTVETIPDAWYWAIITMTTVGYGDITPTTPLGRLVGCICSVAGVLVFSLTIPLFVNQFMTLYQYAEVDLPKIVEQQRDTKHGFSVRVDRNPKRATLNKDPNIMGEKSMRVKT